MSEHKTMPIVWYASAQHITWGALLLWDDSVSRITAIATLSPLFPNKMVEAVVLIAVGVSAIVAMIRPTKNAIINCCGIVPQQILLIASAAGSVVATINGQYPDGYQTERVFIFADVGTAYVFAAVFHTFALWRIFGAELWKRLL